MKLEAEGLGCYKAPMTKKGEKKSELVGAMVTPTVKSRLQEIAEETERSLSYISAAFIERGLAAYEEDGLLKENNNGIDGDTKPSTTKARVLPGYRKAEEKKNRRA